MLLHVFTLVANIFFSIYKLLSLTCIVGICAPALGSCTPFKPSKFQLTNAFFKMSKGTSSGQQRSCPHGSLHSRTWTGLGTPGHGYCCCLYIINWLGQPKDCLEPLTISRCFRMAFHPFAHVASCCPSKWTPWAAMRPYGTMWDHMGPSCRPGAHHHRAGIWSKALLGFECSQLSLAFH